MGCFKEVVIDEEVVGHLCQSNGNIMAEIVFQSQFETWYKSAALTTS